MITETDAVQMAIVQEDGHYLFASYEQIVPADNAEVLSKLIKVNGRFCPYCGSKLNSVSVSESVYVRFGLAWLVYECGSSATTEIGAYCETELIGASKRTPGCLLRTGYTEDEDAI